LLQVISGNSLTGLGISASGVIVQGNKIGTDVTGTRAIPNNFGGVWAVSGAGIIIGGNTTASGNLISGNAAVGVRVSGEKTQATIQGNIIGKQTPFSLPI